MREEGVQIVVPFGPALVGIDRWPEVQVITPAGWHNVAMQVQTSVSFRLRE